MNTNTGRYSWRKALDTVALEIKGKRSNMYGKKSLWPLGGMTLASVLAFYLARHYAVSNPQAISLALMVYLHGLWFSPLRRELAVPLVRPERRKQH